jgi:peptidoglycan/LPS O-acetylase OafA/YrhL
VVRARPTTAKTLNDVFDPEANSLNAIRLVLATAVIVSHSWPLGGFGHDPQVGGVNLGQWAVAGFFAISGWLITGSRLQTDVTHYLWRRFLRIYPGYFVCLFAVAFGFASLAAGIGNGGWSLASALGYVVRNLPLQVSQWSVGTTLEHIPWPDTWNSPLWTLAYEFICYLLVGALVTLSRRWLPATVTTVLLLAVAVQAAEAWAGVVLPEAVDRGSRLAATFFAGALLYLLRRRIPASGRVAAVSSVVLVASTLIDGSSTLGVMPVAYLCIWLGAHLPLQQVGRRNDISYGMYIYGWPVQQSLTLLGVPGHGVRIFLLLSVLCTVPPAAASWVLVERPASRLKGLPRLTRRLGPPAR